MSSTHYSCPTLRNLNFLHTLLENTKISNLMKIRPGGAEVLHAEADGPTEKQT
jgi:hypothetical protein